MSTNEFDKLLAQKANQATFAYEPGDWEGLSTQLAAARRKKRIILFAYTASGMAACAAIVLFLFVTSRPKKEMLVVHTAPVHSVIPETAPVIPPQSNVNINTGTAVVFQAHHIAIKRSTVTHTATNDHQPLFASTDNPATNTRSNTNKIQDTLNTVTIKANKEVPERITGSTWPNVISPEPVKNKVHISVGGGVNYGTLNTGYALTAMADRKFGKKFSVEVAVGYINNNGSLTTPGIIAPPNSNVMPRPPTTVSLPLNYLQFAPVAGYGFSKKITIALGADVERLLQDHDETITYNYKNKIAPTFDMGVLLKTDYAVTQRLKAGISYRIGANNLLSPGNNYVDRNYMQVQLKYRLH